MSRELPRSFVTDHDGFTRRILRAVTSPDGDGLRRCGEKRQLNHNQARSSAARIAKELDEPVEAYKCPYCRRWHIGHPTGWRYIRNEQRQIQVPIHGAGVHYAAAAD